MRIAAPLALSLSLLAQPAVAQPAVAQTATMPVPGEMELARLVWSTMAAIGQANETGNYSVLRDLSAPGFQQVNDQSKLTQIFSGLRSSGVDLSATLLATPIYRAPPRMVQPGTLQLVGTFGLRPQSVNFEMLYQWIGGKWRLFGVAVVPISTAILPSSSATAPPLKR